MAQLGLDSHCAGSRISWEMCGIQACRQDNTEGWLPVSRPITFTFTNAQAWSYWVGCFLL